MPEIAIWGHLRGLIWGVVVRVDRGASQGRRELTGKTLPQKMLILQLTFRCQTLMVDLNLKDSIFNESQHPEMILNKSE